MTAGWWHRGWAVAATPAMVTLITWSVHPKKQTGLSRPTPWSPMTKFGTMNNGFINTQCYIHYLILYQEKLPLKYRYLKTTQTQLKNKKIAKCKHDSDQVPEVGHTKEVIIWDNRVERRENKANIRTVIPHTCVESFC